MKVTHFFEKIARDNYILLHQRRAIFRGENINRRGVYNHTVSGTIQTKLTNHRAKRERYIPKFRIEPIICRVLNPFVSEQFRELNSEGDDHIFSQT